MATRQTLAEAPSVASGPARESSAMNGQAFSVESALIDIELGMAALELLDEARKDPGTDRHERIAPGALAWAIEKLRQDVANLREAFGGCAAGPVN